MSRIEKVPRTVWRLLRFPPQFAYAVGLGSLLGRMVLLLETKGRHSGKWRVTPLQYERVDGQYFIAAARGMQTDWLRNIAADPHVKVRVGAVRIQAQAEIVVDPDQIADFLALRLRNRPRFVGLILRLEGFPGKPDHADLVAYAAKRAMVVLHPENDMIASEPVPSIANG